MLRCFGFRLLVIHIESILSQWKLRNERRKRSENVKSVLDCNCSQPELISASVRLLWLSWSRIILIQSLISLACVAIVPVVIQNGKPCSAEDSRQRCSWRFWKRWAMTDLKFRLMSCSDLSLCCSLEKTQSQSD